MRGSPEAEVVHSLKQHLIRTGLWGSSVGGVLVDADGSYRNSRYAQSLEPMACVPINGARPDLLCTLTDGASCLVGFEVKPNLDDWLKGLAQAAVYRAGVHYSFLALPASDADTRRVTLSAADFGVGVFRRTPSGWEEALRPPEPKPHPGSLHAAVMAVEGVPLARRLQLNHPLNYLAVAFLLARHPQLPVVESLRAGWADLSTDGTRRHAIAGAKALGLVDLQDGLTLFGATVADLLEAVRFRPEARPSKRARLADAGPELAAIVRSVLLRQPGVVLTLEVLRSAKGHSLGIQELWERASARDEVLGRALFLSDPSRDLATPLRPEDYNPSTVFKFKQVLWHAGLLATKAEGSAGGAAVHYQPSKDIWALEDKLIERLQLPGA
jgi:hypothetical protein